MQKNPLSSYNPLISIRMRSAGVLRVLAVIACMVMQSGCRPKPEINPPAEMAQSAVKSDYQSVAETTLGEQAAVVANGDLAKTGRLQLLIVDRSGPVAPEGDRVHNTSPILITRAAILEKSGDKWVELLRCDEHLKNSHGYLQGAPLNPVTGWILKFTVGNPHGLDMQFSPADEPGERPQASNGEGPRSRPVEVRWNQQTRRYQSLDSSGDQFLDEIPALEIQHSILK